MQTVHVVAWDPTGKLSEGEVLDGQNATQLAKNSGAVLMPVDDDLANQAVAGYFHRGWGAGWEYNQMQGERGCPMLLFVHVGRRWLHWALRIEPIPGEKPLGLMRLTTDSSRPNAMSGGLSAHDAPIDLGLLGPVDERGGWTVRGKLQVSHSGSGYLALNFYGSCQGVRVPWTACSQTSVA